MSSNEETATRVINFDGKACQFKIWKTVFLAKTHKKKYKGIIDCIVQIPMLTKYNAAVLKDADKCTST